MPNPSPSPSPSLRPPSSAMHHHSTAVAPPVSVSPNLTTSVYHTDLGTFSLTWCRSSLARTLHLVLHRPSTAVDGGASSSFHLHIRPFVFWNKYGSKKLGTNKRIHVFWDLTRAKFGSQPEPSSGFYIAVVSDGQITLLVGDSPVKAYAKSRALKPRRSQVMVLRREHVFGNRLYTTKAAIGGQSRDISIDCRVGDDAKLYFSVDQKRVLEVKHLKWKFRGNERIEVDGIYIQVSWDVHNWLFEHDNQGHALFMFRFEKLGFEDEEEEDEYFNCLNREENRSSTALCSSGQACGFAMEEKKMKKRLKRTAARSSSSSATSSSMSSASSGCSSVMEWESVEENELKDPSGFSLIVYAWKKLKIN